MDKPLCRLCHHRHWASEDHVWPMSNVQQPLDKVSNVQQMSNVQSDVQRSVQRSSGYWAERKRIQRARERGVILSSAQA
jgi:hypothetical protein